MDEVVQFISNIQFEELIGWLTAFFSAGGLYFAFQVVKLIITCKKSDKLQTYLENMQLELEEEYKSMLEQADEKYSILADELQKEQKVNAEARMKKLEKISESTNEANSDLQRNIATLLDSIDEE